MAVRHALHQAAGDGLRRRSAGAAKRCARSSATSTIGRTIATRYFYAVQWIYTVHAGGAVVHNRAEDRKRAHDYADAYQRARGPQAALVKQWIDYLDTEK